MFKEGYNYAKKNKLEAAYIIFVGSMAVGVVVGGVSVVLEELGLIELDDNNSGVLEKKPNDESDSGMIPLENGLTAQINNQQKLLPEPL